MKKILLILFVVLLSAVIPLVQATRPHYVYDRANVLTTEDITSINSLCESVDTNTTAEIVCVILSNLDSYGGDIDAARETIFNDESLDGVKGIGKPDVDNGVLIVLSLPDSHWGIEVGYGLEGNLTDSECGRIGRELIKPKTLEGNYSGALFDAVAAISIEIGGGSFATGGSEDNTWLIIILVIALFGVIGFFILLAGGGRGGDGGSSSSGGGYGGSGGGGGFGGGGSGGGGASG